MPESLRGISLVVPVGDSFSLILFAVFVVVVLIFAMRPTEPKCPKGCGVRVVWMTPDRLLTLGAARGFDPIQVVMSTLDCGSLYECPKCGEFLEKG